MQLLEMRERVQNLFGDPDEALITIDEINDWLNDAQLTICRDTGWLAAHAETNIVAGQRAYQLPDEVVEVERVELDGKKIPQTTLQMVDQEDAYNTSASGVPDRYYVWGNKIYLYPTPTEEGTGNLDIWFSKTPALMVNDTDLPEIPSTMHTTMVNYALAQANKKDEEHAVAGSILAGVEVDKTRHKQQADHTDAPTFPSISPAVDDEGWNY